MKKFLILGLLVIIIPLLGIPMAWKTLILILIGLFIVISSVTYHREDNQDSRKKDLEEEPNLERTLVEIKKDIEE